MNPRFNHEKDCFALPGSRGVLIYKADPLDVLMYREELKNIRIVEMLHRTNITALVGDSLADDRFPSNQVVLWDDSKKSVIGKLQFRSEIKAVKLRKDVIVIAIVRKVYVYKLDSLQLVHTLDTFIEEGNRYAVLSLSHSPHGIVCAFPAHTTGLINVHRYDLFSPANESRMIINAADHSVRCMEMTPDGSRLATASERGTLIRVFCTSTLDKLFEFRRGADPAIITNITFSPFYKMIAVGSSKGTVHLFSLGSAERVLEEMPPVFQPFSPSSSSMSTRSPSFSSLISSPSKASKTSKDSTVYSTVPAVENKEIEEEKEKEPLTHMTKKISVFGPSLSEKDLIAAAEFEDPRQQPKIKEERDKKKSIVAENIRSTFSFASNLLPSYFSSEWSFARFYTNTADDPLFCAFSTTEKNALIVLSSKGLFWKVKFDIIRGGECIIEKNTSFLI